MTELATQETTASAPAPPVNIARRLSLTAAQMPEAVAVVMPRGRRAGRRQYDTYTFAELEAESNRLASGLRAWGVTPGMRIALLVRPGWERRGQTSTTTGSTMGRRLSRS